MYYLAALDEPVPEQGEGVVMFPAGMVGRVWQQFDVNPGWCIIWSQQPLAKINDRRIRLGVANARLGAGHRADLRRLAGLDVPDGWTVGDLLDSLVPPEHRKRRPPRAGSRKPPIRLVVRGRPG